MDRMPFYGERGSIPFFLGRKSSVCKKRLWTKWFCILSQPLFVGMRLDVLQEEALKFLFGHRLAAPRDRRVIRSQVDGREVYVLSRRS